MKKINKILIANRGEIAVRIMRAAKELQISTVTVYSEVDRSAYHVRFADEIFYIQNKGIEPYLDIDQVLDVAKDARVDAIHPGYGFLSENPLFARKVVEAGFIFIGPSSQTIDVMGNKLKAKEIAIEAGIPVIPGFRIGNEKDSDLITKIEEIGYPVLVKASSGGGGKGMHIIRSAEEIHEQISLSIREAKAAFGDDTVFIEKLILKPRHIEFQILADHHGNCVHLFERECTIQRRHQKVVEEAPSTVLDENLRRKMGKAAIDLARACNYANAGTIEFIMDKNRNFYFLEMNTRLQVEHPVTEFITGIDMVKQQIMIAQGAPLQVDQNNISIRGHAMELRVYAEDPHNSFLPDVGKLNTYKPPKGPGVRVDDGCEEGMDVPVEYDPLLAKLVTYGETRTEARLRMIRAIDEYEISGVKNTLDFGKFVMKDADFCSGDFDTNFIDQRLEEIENGMNKSDISESMVAAVISSEIMNNSVFKNPNHKIVKGSGWRNRMKK